jgi:hypothetical protein
MVPAMGPDRVGVSWHRLLALLAATCSAFVALPALARAADSWQSGPSVESQDSNCVTGNGEQEAGSWLSYYFDPSAPPQINQTYYVAIDLAGIGDPCAGIYSDIELALPSGTTPAITTSDPVVCYLKFPNSSTYKRDTQDCPQSLGAGEYGYSLDPVHANPPFWPTARGSDVEIQVPVVSTQAGDLQLKGVVQLADGESDPILQPTLQMVVDSAGAQDVGGQNDQIGVYYNSPSLTTNQQQSNTSTTVTYVGWVQNNANNGNVVAQVAYADSSGDCNTPGTIVDTTNEALLQDAQTEISGDFTGLYADVAYCWRLKATVVNGTEAGTYYGNWQYFITNGTYYTYANEPAAANAPAVTQCAQSDATGDGCGYSGCSTSTCTTTGTTASATEPLDLTLSGSGSGTVNGPASFSCTASCTGNFASGSTVTLTAVAASGSSFFGWSGGGCSGRGSCTVTMSAAQDVTAEFLKKITVGGNETLLVSLTGAGSGKVTSSGGISCPTTCTGSYNHDTAQTLTATAAPGSTFAGWSGGGCSGTGTCKVLMTTNQSITAEFTLNPPNTDTLTVSLAGAGSGKVTSSGGISCPSSCDHVYTSGTSDTLTAVAAPGSRFTGWSGGGCSGTGTCKVTVSSALDVTANFALVPPSCSLAVSSSKVTLRKRHKSPPVDTLVLIVKCSQATSARVTGALTERLSRKHSERFKLGPATASVAAGMTHTFDIKLSGSAIKGLKHGHRESVSLALTATNANGSATARASAGRLRGSG